MNYRWLGTHLHLFNKVNSFTDPLLLGGIDRWHVQHEVVVWLLSLVWLLSYDNMRLLDCTVIYQIYQLLLYCSIRTCYTIKCTNLHHA